MLRAYIKNFAALSAFSGLLFAATPLCDFGLCHEVEAKPIAAEAVVSCHGPAQPEPAPVAGQEGDCSHCSWLMAVQAGNGYPLFVAGEAPSERGTASLKSISFQLNPIHSVRPGTSLWTSASGQLVQALSEPSALGPLFELNAVWRI